MTDAILVIGGGVAGLTAALACAEAGARVIVAENGATVGGKLAAAMTDDSSVGDSIDGVPIPKLSKLAATANIEFITLARLEGIEGRPGNFDVSIRERARFVTDACTLCRRCRPVCPSVSSNEYDAGLTYRKAIFQPLPQTLPQEYVIDIDSCLNNPPNYLPCNRCIDVCDDNAIHFDMPLDRMHKKQVGAVIVSVGFDMGADSRLQEYGYGTHPDIVTSAELQRLLMSPGPTGGFVAKPSNEEYPESILLILDEVSPFAAYTAISQIHQLVDQDIDRVDLLITEQRSAEKQHEFTKELPASITVNEGLLQSIAAKDDNKIAVSYADFASNRLPKDEYDMVVLSSEPRPEKGLAELAGVLGLDLNDAGYVATPADAPCSTSREGVFVTGGARGPVTLHDTVDEARVTATAALGHLDPRLLKPGFSVTPQAETEANAPSDEELRARIERALYALINK